MMHWGFVQPNFFWALGALAIPVIVHLVFRRQSRRVDLGTLRFMKAVVQANAKTRNLKRLLLLALRLILIALLVATFARPHLRGFEKQGSKDFMAILIDRSASMERRGNTGRLIDQAIQEAKQIVEELGAASDLRIAFFDHAVHPIDLSIKSENPIKSLEEQLQAPQNLWGATNFSSAIEWARDACVKSPHSKRTIVLFTDLQRAGLDWAETEPMPPDVAVRIVDLGQPQTANLAVTSVKIASIVVRPGKSTSVTATIFNAGPFAVEKTDVVMHASHGNRQINVRQQISLVPGSSGSVEFETPDLSEGLWRGFIELEHEDDLKYDNKRWFAMLVAPPLSTLIVDGQPDDLPQRAASFYLETALRLAPPGEVAPERLFEPTVLPVTTNLTLPDFKPFSLIVLANVSTISPANSKRLANWVSAGGGLLVFAGESTTAEGMNSLIETGLGAGLIRGFATSDSAPWRLEYWNSNNPIFDLFGDVQRGDLSRRSFRGITRINPAGDATVLAQFSGGAPAVLERTVDRGKVIWFAAGCDAKHSDWPRTRLYLPLNYQLLSYLGGLSEGGPVRNVFIDSQTEAESAPGIFEDGIHWNAVNVSPRESETDRCTVEEFSNRFGIVSTGNSGEQAVPAQAVSAGFDLRADEFWHNVLLIVLGLVLIEGFLANRTVS